MLEGPRDSNIIEEEIQEALGEFFSYFLQKLQYFNNLTWNHHDWRSKSKYCFTFIMYHDSKKNL